MAAQRPTGVTILAVIQFIGGALSLLWGVASLFFGGLMVATDAAAETEAAVDMGPVMMGVGILALVSGLLGLTAGYGLFTLKRWGWTLAIVFAVLNIVHQGVSVIRGGNVVGAVIAIVISGLILYYLFRPTVKQAFGRA